MEGSFPEWLRMVFYVCLFWFGLVFFLSNLGARLGIGGVSSLWPWSCGQVGGGKEKPGLFTIQSLPPCSVAYRRPHLLINLYAITPLSCSTQCNKHAGCTVLMFLHLRGQTTQSQLFCVHVLYLSFCNPLLALIGILRPKPWKDVM